MAIKMTNCHFENNGTGIKAPTSANIDMSGTTFKGNGKAMDIYISSADLVNLGLPKNTPQEYIQEVVAILQKQVGAPQKDQIESISNSALFKWLGHGASISTIGSALISFIQTL